MKTSNCNHQIVDRYLKDNMHKPGAADAELSSHLDICLECREYFAASVATREFWDEASILLKASEFDSAGRAEFSAGSTGAAPVSTLQIKDVLARLAPSDDPQSLGRLGGYEVTGVVGAGAMGVVLKAIDTALDRVVAIKVLAPHLANSGTARRRFEREAKAVAAILHPNVIPIHSVSGEGEQPYFVMSYIRGESLQKRIDDRGPFQVEEILRIAHQIAAGLSAAHSKGLVHRDIKPANILLEGETERVSITDFGLARAVDDVTLTRAGVVAGTPQYMSPEQSNAETVDQRSDLFSLGSVLYALCTGRPPFRSDTSYGLIREINESKPRPIQELNPAIPDWLCNLVTRLLSKDKNNRFRNADEVCSLVESCMKHAEQPATVAIPTELLDAPATRIRKIVFALAIAVLLMTSLGVIGMRVSESLQTDDPSSDVTESPKKALSSSSSPVLSTNTKSPANGARIESGTYILTLDVPAMSQEGPIKVDATVAVDSERVTVEVAEPSIMLTGQFCDDGKLRLNTTSLERNRVVSNHFIGDVSNGSVSGAVHFFGNEEKAASGAWTLVPKSQAILEKE